MRPKQAKSESELKKYLTARVTRDITYKSWQFKGNKFMCEGFYWLNDFCVTVVYSSDINELNVLIQRGSAVDRSCEQIAEKSFKAIADCVEWTVDKLMQIYRILAERTAPYENGRQEFERDKLMYEYNVRRPIGRLTDD